MKSKEYTISAHPLKELIQERISDYYNVLVKEGLFDRGNLEDIIFSLNTFGEKAKESLLRYILLLDDRDYEMDIHVKFYFKRSDKYIGYDTTTGELKRYESNNKIELIEKLRG